MRNRGNFHKNTTAIFAQRLRPSRRPDHVSTSGSEYWYTDHGVYRHSDHWGEVASCYWLINEQKSRRPHGRSGRWLTGYAKWEGFSARKVSWKLFGAVARAVVCDPFAIRVIAGIFLLVAFMTGLI